MAEYLPSSDEPDKAPTIADMRIFWGPEICRLEYLRHLIATGRITDDSTPEQSDLEPLDERPSHAP